VTSDRAASAARLASIDAQSLGFSSSTSAYVQYIKADEDVQVSQQSSCMQLKKYAPTCVIRC
jgi:hypothetical protein